MSEFLKPPPPRVAAPVDQAELLGKIAMLVTLALVVTALYVGRAGSLERAAAALRNIGGQITESAAPDAAKPPGAPARPPAGQPQNQAGQPQNKAEPVPVEIRPSSDPLSFERLQAIASTVLEPLATAGIVLVFVIFILFQREDLRDRFIRLAGSGDLQRTTAAMNDAARRLSRYFLFQTLMNATFGVFIGLGLWFIGLPSPFLCGA